MPKPRRATDLPSGVTAPINLIEAADNLDKHLQTSTVEVFNPIQTGFPQLDEYLGGGFHAGDFAVLGGVQNVGKTAIALQLAGQIVEDKSVLCIFVCYEHSTQNLFERLIIQHSFTSPDKPNITAKMLTEAYIKTIEKRDQSQEEAPENAFHHLQETVTSLPDGVRVWAELMRKQNNIWLVTGHSIYADTKALDAYFKMGIDLGFKRIVMFVDYIQRVPFFITNMPYIEDKVRIDYVLRYLKSTSLEYANQGIVAPIIGVGAADEEGLRLGRVHMENLWGSSIMQYEPDIALIMNKDPINNGDHKLIRVGLEKNRWGPADVEWRHRHYGSAFLFEREGRLVNEEESFQGERKYLRMELEAQIRAKEAKEINNGSN